LLNQHEDGLNQAGKDDGPEDNSNPGSIQDLEAHVEIDEIDEDLSDLQLCGIFVARMAIGDQTEDEEDQDRGLEPQGPKMGPWPPHKTEEPKTGHCNDKALLDENGP